MHKTSVPNRSASPSKSGNPSGGVSSTSSTDSALSSTASAMGSDASAASLTSPTVMSTIPTPDFSTEMVTNSAWSVNTLIATTQSGSSSATVVPVLVGCKNCGGQNGGIILWGLPALPRIDWHFPKFPKLPSFTIPCSIFCASGGPPPPGGNPIKPPITDPENPTDPSPSQSQPQTSSTTSSTTLSIVVVRRLDSIRHAPPSRQAHQLALPQDQLLLVVARPHRSALSRFLTRILVLSPTM